MVHHWHLITGQKSIILCKRSLVITQVVSINSPKCEPRITYLYPTWFKRKYALYILRWHKLHSIFQILLCLNLVLRGWIEFKSKSQTIYAKLSSFPTILTFSMENIEEENWPRHSIFYLSFRKIYCSSCSGVYS